MRKKIGISFTFFILTSTVVWTFNFYNHYQLTKKIELIDEKIDLLSTVLEFRRYEKNFFLYFNLGDLKEAISYAGSAVEKQEKIFGKYEKFMTHIPFRNHLEDLKIYKTSLENLLEAVKHGKNVETYQLKIRIIGKRITNGIEKIVENERGNIWLMIRKANLYLYLALAAIFILSAVTGVFILLNVNAPLKQIELAIHEIAKGDYSSIPAINTGDIFESLVNSVNQMIKVLNQRNEQLIHSEKLASLGTLTSGVAHELNNPLTNMSTSIQIIMEELEDGDYEYKYMLLRETEKQIDRARDIIKGLLEFSRETSFIPQQVEVKMFIERTMKLIKGEIPSNINQRFDLEEGLIVKIGVTRIQQVLINLIINAVHAMEEKGGDLMIRAKHVDEKQFCFWIEDTGKGIRQEDLERVFDPFYTDKEVGRGTGLGLSISHGIVESHRGRIEVESKVDKGTIFTVYLPVECNIIVSGGDFVSINLNSIQS